MAKSKKDIIKNSLVTQLKLRKADTPFFLAMVEEYIYFYERLTELKKIVKKVLICKGWFLPSNTY